jgi:hypothetical protein
MDDVEVPLDEVEDYTTRNWFDRWVTTDICPPVPEEEEPDGDPQEVEVA